MNNQNSSIEGLRVTTLTVLAAVSAHCPIWFSGPTELENRIQWTNEKEERDTSRVAEYIGPRWSLSENAHSPKEIVQILRWWGTTMIRDGNRLSFSPSIHHSQLVQRMIAIQRHLRTFVRSAKRSTAEERCQSVNITDFICLWSEDRWAFSSLFVSFYIKDCTISKYSLNEFSVHWSYFEKIMYEKLRVVWTRREASKTIRYSWGFNERNVQHLTESFLETVPGVSFNSAQIAQQATMNTR